MRMYFDSDEAWSFLITNGYVYTARAISSGSKIFSKVEFFRHRKTTGRFGSKNLVSVVSAKTGKPSATIYAGIEKFIFASGFTSKDEWLAKATSLSGKQIEWGIYDVRIFSDELIQAPGEEKYP